MKVETIRTTSSFEWEADCNSILKGIREKLPCVILGADIPSDLLQARFDRLAYVLLVDQDAFEEMARGCPYGEDGREDEFAPLRHRPHSQEHPYFRRPVLFPNGGIVEPPGIYAPRREIGRAHV